MNDEQAYNIHKLTQDIATTLELSRPDDATHIIGADVIYALEHADIITKTEANKIRQAREDDGY